MKTLQEIQSQAMAEVLNGPDPDGDIDKMYIPNQFTEKFTELLVKELIRQVETNGRFEVEVK